MQILRSSQENVNLESYNTPEVSPNQNSPELASQLMKQASQLQQQNIEESQNLILIASPEKSENKLVEEKIIEENLIKFQQVLVKIQNGNFKLNKSQTNETKEFVPEAVEGLQNEEAQRLVEQAIRNYEQDDEQQKKTGLETVLGANNWEGISDLDELKRIVERDTPNPHMLATFFGEVEEKIGQGINEIGTVIEESASTRVEKIAQREVLTNSSDTFRRREESRKQQATVEKQSQEELFKQEFIPASTDSQAIKNKVPPHGWVTNVIQGFNNLWS